VRPTRFVRIASSQIARRNNPERLSNRDNFHSTPVRARTTTRRPRTRREKEKTATTWHAPCRGFEKYGREFLKTCRGTARPRQYRQNPVVENSRAVVIFRNPVVVMRKPRVIFFKPVVEPSDPRLFFRRPRVEISSPVMVFQKPVVDSQNPVVVYQKGVVDFGNPVVVFEKVGTDFPKTGVFRPFSRLSQKMGGQKATGATSAIKPVQSPKIAQPFMAGSIVHPPKQVPPGTKENDGRATILSSLRDWRV
jgi:hypothetical protein